MLKILLLLFEFNYIFTFGIIPLDDLQIYELEENAVCYFVEFESEIVVVKTFFISGMIKTNVYERKFLKQYSPYQIGFEVKIGVRFKFIKFGFSHFCVHL